MRIRKFLETLNVRLPLEITSVRHENLGKRVSDDSQRFIFRHRKKKSERFFFQKNFGSSFFVQETGVLEELGFFEPRWQIRRQKLLPVVRLFFHYERSRRGKSGTPYVFG